MKYFKVPGGMFDTLPEENRILDEIISKLEDNFKQNGFEKIDVAGIEYYDNFTAITSPIDQKRMFKTTDNDGSLLVVTPDISTSVARVYATKLLESQNKLYYFKKVYEANGNGVKDREIYQAGVEIFGENSALADALTIAFAIECLLSLGLKNFKIDIGNVRFFKGLVSGSGLSADEIEKVSALVNHKDVLSAKEIIEKCGNKFVSEGITALPTLFGGKEILDLAKKYSVNEETEFALSRLTEVYNLLEKFGLEKYISIDLGLVKDLSYYSGIIFTGLTEFVGSPILSGGRYDYLTENYGKKSGAIGFAIGLKRLLGFMKKPEKPANIVCVMAEVGYEDKCQKYAKELISKGFICDYYSGQNLQDFINYAKGKSVKTAFMVGEKITLVMGEEK